MKKFLFTLATIVTFGLAADAAGHTIDFTWVTPTGFDADKQEISIDPNGTATARRATFHYKAGGFDQPVIGWQVAYRAYDPEGNILGPDAKVHLRAVGGLYFRKESSGPSILPENSYANNYDESKQWYIALGANLTYGVVWELADWLETDFGGEDAFYDDLGGSEAMLTYPANVIQFQVEVDADWDGEYVDFDFVDEKYKITFYDTYSISGADADSANVHPEFDFRVVNPNAGGTKTIAGTVDLGALNDGFDVPVTINMTDPTEGYVVNVTVNGETATIENGIIVLPDVAGEYVVNVTITADGYEGKVEANKTYTIEQAAQPQISFTEGETGVTINVENYTSYEVIVDGVNKGQINFVEEDWAEQTVVVNATNAPAGYLPATASNNTTVGVKDNYKLEGTISIGAVENETGKIYVAYSGDEQVTLTATANGQPIDVVDGYITLPAYGEYEIVVTATPAAEHTDALVSDPATRVWNAPELADKPVINIVTGETGATISVENYTSYEVIVNGENKGQINFVEKDWVEQTIVVNATNAPEGYYTPNYETATATLGVKDNYKLQGEITIGAVDQSNGQVYIVYTGEEEVNLSVSMTEKREVINIQGNNGYIQLPERDVVYEIVATAIATAEHYDALVSETAERIWNSPNVYTVVTPTVAGEQTETAYVINVTNTDPYATTTLYVTVTDMEGNSTTTTYTDFPVSIPRDNNDYMISYYAQSVLTEAPEGYDDWTNASTSPKTDYIDALPQLPTLDGNVTVTVDQLGNVTATYDGDEDVTIVVNPSHLDNYGEDIPVTVTVTADGYQDLVVNTTVDYLEKTAAPGGSKENYVFKENGIYYNSYTITLHGTDPDADADIYYRIGVMNEDGVYEYGEWILYTGPFNVTEPGQIMVETYAIATGKTESDHIWDGFKVDVATSIDELFADKAVANVRYFNMAGQEMQQANGICVTVYTFTDGTQVAVKVMK